MAERLNLSLEDLFYILTGDKQACGEEKERIEMQKVFQSAFEKMLDTGILSPSIRERLKERVEPSHVQVIIKKNTMMIDEFEYKIRDLYVRIQECTRIIEMYESRIRELELIREPGGGILPLTLITSPLLPPNGNWLPWPLNKIIEEQYKAEAERRKAEIEQLRRLIEQPKDDIKQYKYELEKCKAEIEQCKTEIKRCEIILAE